MDRLARIAGFAALLLGVLLAAGRPAAAQAPALVLAIDGGIGPATADYVARGLRTAVARQAPLVILRLDTPGGLDRAMRSIVADILSSPVPVACLVAPSGARAASAGTYILMACPVAAMAPGTTLGAATPVELGGGKPADPKDPHVAKAVNDAAAFIRGLAELHGRNAAWAEQAVRQAASLTAEEALRQKVVYLLAADPAALARAVDGRTALVDGAQRVLATRGVAIEPLPMPWHSRLLAVLTDPEVAYLLLTIGIWGVIFEMMAPGHIFPGVVGGVSLLVALYGLNLLPLNMAGAALLALGVALMAAEPFIVSHGILGLGGALAFAVGSVMMFATAGPGFSLPWGVAAAGALGSFVVVVWGVGLALRARRKPQASGGEALLGRAGVVTDWVGRGGHVHVEGEEWQARGAPALRPGQAVVVKGRRGLVLTVGEAGPGAGDGGVEDGGTEDGGAEQDGETR